MEKLSFPFNARRAIHQEAAPAAAEEEEEEENSCQPCCQSPLFPLKFIAYFMQPPTC